MSHRATAFKRPRCRVPRPCLSGLRACDYSCLLDRPCLEAAHGSRRLLLRGLSAQFVRFCSRRPDGCRADGRPLPVRVTDSVISRLRPAASPLAAAAAAGRARNADVAARARLLAGASRSERLRCCRASSAVPGRSLPPAGRPRRSRVQVVPGIEANGAFFFLPCRRRSAARCRPLAGPPQSPSFCGPCVVFSSVQSRTVRPFNAVHAPLQKYRLRRYTGSRQLMPTRSRAASLCVSLVTFFAIFF